MEVAAQLVEDAIPAPTHLFLQAGVGGFAAAMAQGLAGAIAMPRRVVVVEPAAAACVAAALTHGAPVQIEGTLETCADMLSCGAASAPALNILLRHDAVGMHVAEADLRAACETMAQAGGPASTASGVAGLAGLIAVCRSAADRERLAVDSRSVILLFVTEGA